VGQRAGVLSCKRVLLDKTVYSKGKVVDLIEQKNVLACLKAAELQQKAIFARDKILKNVYNERGSSRLECSFAREKMNRCDGMIYSLRAMN